MRTSPSAEVRAYSAAKKRKTDHQVMVCFSWQRNRDSNPNIQSQSLLCYRYTIPLGKIIKFDKRRFCEPHIQSLLLGGNIFKTFRLADIKAYISSPRNIPSECRVCCATVTQFRYSMCSFLERSIFYHKKIGLSIGL